MAYKWILFDADNTIFDFHASSEIAFHMSFKEHNFNSTDEHYDFFNEINLHYWGAYDRNEISHEEIKRIRFEKLFEKIGFNGVDPLAFNSLYFRKLVEYPRFMNKALELLKELKGKYKLGIITNGMEEVQRPRLHASGIFDLFEIVIISGEIGYSKPNRAFFSYAYQKMQEVNKGEVLVVGDNLLADIKGGQDFGFKTAWFNAFGITNETGIRADYYLKELSQLRNVLKPEIE